MGGPGSGHKREKENGPKGQYDPYFVDEQVGWPKETWCRNVMCRRKWWRAFGESEFCVACRTHLDNCGRKA